MAPDATSRLTTGATTRTNHNGYLDPGDAFERSLACDADTVGAGEVGSYDDLIAGWALNSQRPKFAADDADGVHDVNPPIAMAWE